MRFQISHTIDIPSAEFLGKEGGGRWVFRCAICSGLTLRKNRQTLAGAHICRDCAMEHNETGRTLAEEYETSEREKYNAAVYAMYDHCDASYPDAPTSAGGRWLYGLHTAVTGAWEEGRFGPDSGGIDGDVIQELADAAIPVYTGNRWDVFVDLEAYHSGVDVEDIISAPTETSDLTDMAGYILSQIAYQAMSNWLEEKIRESECDDCGSYPCECEEDETEEE